MNKRRTAELMKLTRSLLKCEPSWTADEAALARRTQRALVASRAGLKSGDDLLSLADFAAKYLRAETASGALVPLVPQSELHRWLVAELETWEERRGQRLAVLSRRTEVLS